MAAGSKSNAKSSWRQAAVGMVVPALVIALWQAVAMLGWVNPQVLPSPLAVVEKWIAYLLPLQPYDPAAESWLSWAVSGELITDSIGSLYRVVVGFVIGAGLALPLGLAMGAKPRVYDWLNPLVQLLRIWSELKKTIIFVTHSIEEAIYLADRIVVMTYRPGTVKRDLVVDLPRMRDPAAAEFNALKRELGQLVMEEQQRHHNDELRMAAVD